jgi:glycerol-3-phosphate dehydrogenase (NAD(P)+)
MTKAAIIGPGSYGTALAQAISPNVSNVYLFGRNEGIITSINKNHINHTYYPRTELNSNITALNLSVDRDELETIDLVIFAVPSGVTREVARSLRACLKGALIVSAAKGIEYPSLKLMSEVIRTETGNKRVSSLSGATFADELMRGFCSSMTFGINKHANKDTFLDVFRRPTFLLDFSDDVRGVELCGVLKNIYAIATGIFDSVSTSNNEHYAFLTLCFKEMRRVLQAFSTDPELTHKFCAFGDLNLTANVDKSRNRTLGLLIGRLSISAQQTGSSIVFEGLSSVRALKDKCSRLHLEIPIIDCVNAALQDPSCAQSQINEILYNFA